MNCLGSDGGWHAGHGPAPRTPAPIIQCIPTLAPLAPCSPSGVGRSRRANAGSRLASLLRQEGGKAAYQEPESESEESQERDGWARHGVVGWGGYGYGLPAGDEGSDSEEEGRGGGGTYSREAGGSQEEADEEPGEEQEGQFVDPMDADYGLADVALQQVCALRWACCGCHAALCCRMCAAGWGFLRLVCKLCGLGGLLRQLADHT